MPNVIRGLRCTTTLVAVIFLAGCAFGTRNATLIYPPKAESGAVSVAQAATKPVPKNFQIVLDTFSDQRTDKKVVGTMRNAYGMRTADVVAMNSVPDWVTQAIKMELQNSGYSVVTVAGGDSVPNASALVSGEIINVFCDMYFNYTGQVSLLARVSKGGKEVLNKTYSGEGSAGVAWAGTAESYAQSLSLALGVAVKQFVADVESNAELKQVDKDALLAEGDAIKQRTRISTDGELAAAATPSPPPVVQTAATAQPISPDPGMATSGLFKPGDQWKYRLSDGRRTIGTVVIKIIHVNGTRIRERITREGTKGFVAEREVDGRFSPIRFLDPVTLPGGYQLNEIAPYLPPGMEIKIGQNWQGVPGEFKILFSGTKKLVSEVKVIGQENVTVPAGSFKAWKIVADVEEAFGVGGDRIKILCTFWYSLETLRTAKMTMLYRIRNETLTTIEVYELIAMEAGR